MGLMSDFQEKGTAPYSKYSYGDSPFFYALTNSKFRSSFKLDDKDKAYIKRLGLAKVESHAKDFIEARLGPARAEKGVFLRG